MLSKRNLLLLICLGWSLLSVLEASQQQFYIRYTKTAEKLVALTFDDGPHPVYTSQILEILERYKVPATFFLLGRNVDRYQDLTLAIYKAGHDIGNHSYIHQNYRYLSDEQIELSLAKSQRAFFRILGSFPTYFRPPYGDVSLAQIPLLSKFFRLGIKWNVDSLDWKWHTDAQAVADQVLSTVSPGAIVLMHDTHPSTVEALPRIIETLHAQGYRFLRVSDLVHEGDLTPVWNQVL